MKSLKGTKTAENLMKAFAGECQARTRYTYYASTAKRKDTFKFQIFLQKQLKTKRNMLRDSISS